MLLPSSTAVSPQREAIEARQVEGWRVGESELDRRGAGRRPL